MESRVTWRLAATWVEFISILHLPTIIIVENCERWESGNKSLWVIHCTLAISSYTRKAVRDRNLCQARATTSARNGLRDVIDHVTIRFANYAISYSRCSTVTESLSPTVFEIFGSNSTNEHKHTHTNKHDESQYLLAEQRKSCSII